MTDIFELFSGIGVVIDDEIDEKGKTPNGIQKIVKSIKDKYIPLLEYKNLPGENEISKLHSISFLILDWNLSEIRPTPEITITENINFIKKLHDICFIPIFIFSDEDPHTIEVKLSEKEITLNNTPLFIKKKEDLDTVEKLFNAIQEWLKKTPPVYVLKEWEKAIREAKTKMLWQLSTINPAWPRILMNTVKKDGGDQTIELIEMLQNNLTYRLSYPVLDINLIKQQNNNNIDKNDLRKILECERFIQKESLPKHPFAGDVYPDIIANDDKIYYINIRPDCDIIRDAERENKEMYLLRGEIIDETKINNNNNETDYITFDSGEFIEKNNCCYIAFIKGNILQLYLKDLKIFNWNDIKDKRIGRLLPPYITRVQQKYAHYIQRQGLPRIPKEAIL
ncbi:hypothetical protein IKO70_01500 [bacterium]|nr:hypothetical protein [bacterium]